MEFVTNEQNTGYVFTRTNGERIEFTPFEINFIFKTMEHFYWRGNIENAIELCDENLDFDSMTEEEFAQYCLEEMKSREECGSLNANPDYEEIVFDVAQENGIWRDE